MSDEVVTTPFGKFLIPKGDLIGETLRAGTLWDGPGFLQPIALEHAALGQEGVTVLDVGANIGSFSVWLAKHGAWRVLAVEPVPQTMQYLKANLDLNKEVCAGHVIPLEIAAYDRQALLAAPPLDLGNLGGTTLDLLHDLSGTIVAFPLDRYDWLFGTRISLIKIDAQGCDGAAILGLAKTIQRHRPTIVFEWEARLALPHGYALKIILQQLTTWGYEVHEWPSQPNNYLARWRP